MTATLAPARPEAVAGRTTFVALAARELRRFVVNPVFLFAVVMTAWTTWDGRSASVTEIDTANPYPAIFLGGFGMMATYWLTRSMRDSEPVVGVTPTTLPARTAALCAVAVVPFLCGVLTLFAFLHFHPIGARVYGAFSPPAQVAVLVAQIVIPSLGGPLLGVALGRWVRFPGAALVLFLVIFGWVNVATVPSLCASGLGGLDGAAAVLAVRVLHVHRQRCRRHGLARVAVVLHRLAARAVRDRGTGGAAARGRRPGALPGHPYPSDRPGGGRGPARAGRPRRVQPRSPRMMVRSMLRAGAWPAVTGISGAAVVVGGCGVAFPAAATVLFPIAFTLLAAAAAFVLDEPASLVVDVTPTGPVRRTAIRSLALLAPLAAGAVLMLAGALRGLALPWPATGLALAGNVVLGFAVACVARTRTGEPGAPASAAVVLILLAPSLLPPVARRVSTFPASGGGLSSNTVWWTVLAVCVAAVAVSVSDRPLPRWLPGTGITMGRDLIS